MGREKNNYMGKKRGPEARELFLHELRTRFTYTIYIHDLHTRFTDPVYRPDLQTRFADSFTDLVVTFTRLVVARNFGWALGSELPARAASRSQRS